MAALPPFAIAKQCRDDIEALYKRAAAELQAISGVGTGAMGLTPDAVKASPTYHAKRSCADYWLKRLQTFNATFVRTYKRELAADRQARRLESVR